MPRGRPADPLKKLRRSLPKAQRAALEQVFEHWHRHYAPLHFTREAFRRYPEQYAASGKRTLRTTRQARKFRDPLYWTGDLEHHFLHGGYFFTGSNKRLRAKWAWLPPYTTMRNRSGFRKEKALVAVSEQEIDEMAELFHQYVTHHLKDISNLPAKTFGRAVL